MRVHYTKINVNNKLQELNVENIDTSLDLHIVKTQQRNTIKKILWKKHNKSKIILMKSLWKKVLRKKGKNFRENY